MASILKHLFHPVATRHPHEIESGPFEIKILGHDDFVATATGALDLLKRSCPDYHQAVVGHVAVIESAREGAGKHHVEPPRISLESSIGYGRDLSPGSTVVWYAGAIVHEAWHSRLYREHRLENPEAPWPADERSALRREDACLQAQHDALLKMGAPPWMLDYVRSQIGLDRRAVADRDW